MEYSGLYDLIKYLEYGTNLHIGVVFLGSNGNKKCALPREHTIHAGTGCDEFKAMPDGLKHCYRCRTYALNKAIRTGKAFGGLCINGVYEYTRPVIIEGKTVCVIYIGNILTNDGYEKMLKKSCGKQLSFECLERDYDLKKCEETGALIESYIRVLLQKFAEEIISENLLVHNIKNYIANNLEYDLSVSSIAKIFSYNEVYLGRIFKKETKLTIKEYINKARILRAAELLKTRDSILAISQKCGFNSVTYFNRLFKLYYAVTPSEYRKNVK